MKIIDVNTKIYKWDLPQPITNGLPNGLILEYYVSTTDPLWGQIYEYDLSLKNGMVSPPDVPGLGLEIKEKNLEKYRVV